jgi:hypothetical protein
MNRIDEVVHIVQRAWALNVHDKVRECGTVGRLSTYFKLIGGRSR